MIDSKKLVSNLAKSFRKELSKELKKYDKKLNIVAFLSTNNLDSKSYAGYTASGCKDVGISYNLVEVEPEKLEEAIGKANSDDSIHGILVYYPIFGNEKDHELKQKIAIEKDLEGLNDFWLKKLYSNNRFYDEEKSMKAILPCTPLAVLKILEAAVQETSPNKDIKSFKNKTITIFNRSRVVGEPLAHMVSNDGAKVYSFDLNNCVEFNNGNRQASKVERKEALATSDIVVTGVPSSSFELIKVNEIKKEAICLNFAGIENFDPEVKDKVQCYIPRIGTVTVAMCLRNSVRLFKRFYV